MTKLPVWVKIGAHTQAYHSQQRCYFLQRMGDHSVPTLEQYAIRAGLIECMNCRKVRTLRE
jgi:hypothetical protein